MRLKNEPTSISFFTNVPASFGLMGDLARVIFAELGREISVLEVSEFGESQNIVGREEIRDYLNQRADTVPDFDSATAYLFYSPLIEGLWREVGADAELTLSFAFNSTGEDHMEIMISSHLFGEDDRLTGNYIRCGKHIFDLIPKSSGFSITGVPYRFFPTMPAAFNTPKTVFQTCLRRCMTPSMTNCSGMAAWLVRSN